MEPNLSQRVAMALRELRDLDGAAADCYLRELRRSEPEVALKLDVVLWAQGSEYSERLATFRDEAAPLGAARTRTDDPAQSSGGWPTAGSPAQPAGELPTGSLEARATASFAHPNPVSPGDGCDLRVHANPILGRYQLLRVVGRGAFGEVWQAYDPVLQKDVAVKAQLRRTSGRPLPPTAFLREARKAASLRHPAILQVYDVGESGDGWYIISEFVEGTSLRARLEAGQLPFDQAARIVATVASALHAAHLAGLVHRDVKPANILLDRAGNAYLTDFGLAVREDEQFAERSRVSGTFAYMPPEQIRGDTHLLDGRADIYALGAVMYEALTGRLPFRAETYDEYLEQILRREPRPPRSIAAVPEELERICLKCLAKAVKDRYPTAQDLAAELEVWLAGSTRSQAAAPARAAPVPRWVKPTVFGAIAVSLLAAVVGVVALGGLREGRRPALTGSEPCADSLPGAAPNRKVTTVKELLWFKKGDAFKWEVLPDNQLKVYTDSTALLQLGQASADAWEFSATLKQLSPKGGAGLFLGYRKDPETGRAEFELIDLVVSGDQINVQRVIGKYQPDAPFVGVTKMICKTVPLKGPFSENTFRLMVRDGRLSEVRINGEPLPSLVTGRLRPGAAGAFGVYNQNSDGVDSDLRFNGAAIPLLTGGAP